MRIGEGSRQSPRHECARPARILPDALPPDRPARPARPARLDRLDRPDRPALLNRPDDRW